MRRVAPALDSGDRTMLRLLTMDQRPETPSTPPREQGPVETVTGKVDQLRGNWLRLEGGLALMFPSGRSRRIRRGGVRGSQSSSTRSRIDPGRVGA